MSTTQNKIYVGNLPYSVVTEDLKSFFGQYGEIQDVKLISDRETGRSKGFAFVTFATAESAQASLASDGTDMKERKIRVNIAKEDDRSRTGGGGRAGGGGRGGAGGGGRFNSRPQRDTDGGDRRW